MAADLRSDPLPRSRLGRLVQGARARWPRLTEVGLFCLVGGSGVVVDYAVWLPLIHLAGLDPRLAAVAAFAVAVSWNYALNRRYTFQQGRQVAVAFSYPAFVAVCTAGVGVRIAAMHLLLTLASWTDPPWLYLTNLVGIVAATAVNYAGSAWLAFRARS